MKKKECAKNLTFDTPSFFVCVPRAGAPPFLTSPARLPVIRRHSGFQSVAGKNDGMTGKMRKT